ncbi:unnamed protein product [Sphenostylis stenocarpa]|uniref:Uncharacterized protein n=1 Tax=Sphenostylis stenocarpa TaxID=92480 RepID=A0AA86VNT6_9FABA|nr:unnamed protein product [Sphenostylis stenocarpa]
MLVLSQLWKKKMTSQVLLQHVLINVRPRGGHNTNRGKGNNTRGGRGEHDYGGVAGVGKNGAPQQLMQYSQYEAFLPYQQPFLNPWTGRAQPSYPYPATSWQPRPPCQACILGLLPPQQSYNTLVAPSNVGDILKELMQLCILLQSLNQMRIGIWTHVLPLI